jgi:AbiEi antitoxin C-terminal domain
MRPQTRIHDLVPIDQPFSLPTYRPTPADRILVRNAVRDGELRQLLRGVYLGANVELTVEMRCAAVALVLPSGAAIARRTAAWLFGVDARLPGEHHSPVVLECVVPHGIEPLSRPGVRCYGTRLTAEDLCQIQTLPCTTPTRTALDLLRWLPAHMGLGAADALAHRGLVTGGELLAATERFAGDRGIAQARRLAGLLEPKTESFGESWTRLRLIEAGFPPPTAQIPVLDAGGSVIYRLDLGWLERKLAAEYDGLEFHSSPEQLAHDGRRRERLASEFGWTVIGLTMGDVLGRSMHLELGFGELLGLQPAISRRRW